MPRKELPCRFPKVFDASRFSKLLSSSAHLLRTLSVAHVLVFASLMGLGCTASTAIYEPSAVRSPEFRTMEYKNIAIFTEAAPRSGAGRAEERIVEDIFTIHLLRAGYNLAARADLDALAREFSYQRSGVTEADAVELGQMIQVDAVLILSVYGFSSKPHEGSMIIPRFQSYARIGARLLDANTAAVLWLDTGEGSYVLEDPQESLFWVTHRMASSFPIVPLDHDYYTPTLTNGRWNEVATARNFSHNAYEDIAIAVFDNSGRMRSEADRRQIEDEFMKEAISKGYRVVSRTDDTAVLDKIIRQERSGITDRKAVEIGRILNAKAMLLVDINSVSRPEGRRTGRALGGEYSVPTRDYRVKGAVSARLISTAEARVLWLASHRGIAATQERSQAAVALATLARELSWKLPERALP